MLSDEVRDGIERTDAEEIDALMALSQNGRNFLHYATYQILRIKRGYTESRYWILFSQLQRGEFERAKRFLDDWTGDDKRPTMAISAFDPGTHYHVGDRKFDRLQDAVDYVETRGCRYSLRTVRVSGINRTGD